MAVVVNIAVGISSAGFELVAVEIVVVALLGVDSCTSHGSSSRIRLLPKAGCVEIEVCFVAVVVNIAVGVPSAGFEPVPVETVVVALRVDSCTSHGSSSLSTTMHVPLVQKYLWSHRGEVSFTPIFSPLYT